MTPCPEADMTFHKWPCQWYARRSLPPMISTSFVRIGTCLMAKYPQNLSRLTNGLLVRGYNLGSPLWFFTGTVLRSFFMSRSCHFFPKILTTTTRLFLSYYPHIAERSISIIMSHGIISWPGSVERRLWFQECLSASCSTLSGVCVVFFLSSGCASGGWKSMLSCIYNAKHSSDLVSTNSHCLSAGHLLPWGALMPRQSTLITAGAVGWHDLAWSAFNTMRSKIHLRHVGNL